MRLTIITSCLAFLALSTAHDASALPAPVSGLFSFPGSNPSPGSAVSAGLALADRWLGDEPFDNPAMARRRGVMVAPVLLRLSRQDLRAGNYAFDEQPAFIDAAGVRAALPVLGFEVAAYGHRFTLRQEDNAFARGELGGPVEPAVIESRSRTLEQRAGLAVARRAGILTLGAAAEWSWRDDEYEVTEQSGSPLAGTRRIGFSGDFPGGQAGLRLELPETPLGAIQLGAAARYLPSARFEGEQETVPLFAAPDTLDVDLERESGWEGGVSLVDRVTPALRVLVGAGGRTARAWRGSGFDVTSGRAWSSSVALEFHDTRDPWTARFGFGREGEEASATPQATVIGLGMGWQWGKLRADLGVVRRSLEAGDAPTSVDDRVVLSFAQEF